MDLEEVNTSPTREKLFLLWNSVQRIVSTPGAKDSKLRGGHVNLVRRHYSQLLSNLSVSDVVVQMFKSGKLTAREHEHLRQFHSTPIRASEELLEIIIISSRDVYECFLDSLKKTNQHHVHQMLTSDEESEQSMFKHSRLIRQNYDFLTAQLETDSGLLTTLYAEEVLSHREHGQVISEKDQSVKNEMLLSIISRKSVEDFKKFIIALNDTLQGHIAKRLTETPVGDVNQNVQLTVKKIISSPCSESTGKRIPPRPPPKPKIQPPTSPLSKPMIIKSLLEQKIHLSRQNRVEKRQSYKKQELVKKQSVDYLETKLRGLPNELQTEVSTKIVLIYQRTSTDSIWKICFTNILQKSRNIVRQSMMQAKAADEKYERQMEEIIQREREFKTIKEDMHREKTKAKEQLRELHERIYELEEGLNLKKNENKNLFERLKASDFNVENLTALNQQKEQKVTEAVSIIETLHTQAMQSEVQLKETRDQLINTEDKFKQNELDLKSTTMKLRETEEKLDGMEADLKGFQAKPIVAEKSTDNSSSEDLFDFKHTLEKERTLWAEERKMLMEQVQELQQESSSEILRRENECKGIKEDIQLEKAVAKKKLTDLQIKISDLEKELNVAIKENKAMSERLKLSEDEVENLKVLKQWKEQEAIVNVSIIERLEEQAKHSEDKFNEMEAQLRVAEEKVKDTETAFKATMGKLKETEKKLRETEANLSQCEAKLTIAETDNYDLGMAECTLKQTLEEERLWAEEKDQLIKQTQDLQKEFSDELQDKYKSDPVLIETIRINAGKKKKLWFRSKASGKEIATRGLTILDKELFVVSQESSEVEVYDSIKLSFSRRWNLKEFTDIYYLVSSVAAPGFQVWGG